jgi:hypothetical protein
MQRQEQQPILSRLTNIPIEPFYQLYCWCHQTSDHATKATNVLILEESEIEDMAFCCTAAELGVVHERLNPSS